ACPGASTSRPRDFRRRLIETESHIVSPKKCPSSRAQGVELAGNREVPRRDTATQLRVPEWRARVPRGVGVNGAGRWVTGSAGRGVALVGHDRPSEEARSCPTSAGTAPDLRNAFARAVRTAGRPVTRAAEDFGTSRKTARERLARFDAQR